jgi:hypothetical protein
VFFKSGRHYNVRFYNNIFYTRNGAPLVVAADTSELDLLFQNNAWYSEDDRYTFVWDESRYTSLQDFQQATGQETAQSQPTGIAANPLLVSPGTAGTLGYPLDLQKLRDRYSLHKRSPLIGKGIAVPLPSAFVPAATDIAGNKIEPDAQPDMGAIAHTRPKWWQWLRKLF